MAWVWLATGATVLYGVAGVLNATTATYRWPRSILQTTDDDDDDEKFATVSLEDAHKYWMKTALLNVVAWPVRQRGDDLDTYCPYDTMAENDRVEEAANGYTYVRCVVPVRLREY